MWSVVCLLQSVCSRSVRLSVLRSSLRLQAYICLKLYNVKKSEVQHLRKAIDENFQVICCCVAFNSSLSLLEPQQGSRTKAKQQYKFMHVNRPQCI